MGRGVRRGPFPLTRSCVPRVRHMVRSQQEQGRRAVYPLASRVLKQLFQCLLSTNVSTLLSRDWCLLLSLETNSFQVLSSSCTDGVPSAPSLKLQCGALPQYLKLPCTIIWMGQTNYTRAQRVPVKVRPQMLNIPHTATGRIQSGHTHPTQTEATWRKIAGRKQRMIFQKWFSDKYIYFSFWGGGGRELHVL